MPIDLDAALDAPARTEELAWTERDVLLYHLSLGAGRGEDPELAYTYEQSLRVLPTFAMVAGQGISAGARRTTGIELPGVRVDLRRILHGGQELTVHRPIPVSGHAVRTTRVADVWDKGRAAVVVLESLVTDPDGAPLWTSRMNLWARGEGGFGGDPGPTEDAALPDRSPDHVLETPTWPGQARLYRLNGDLNPLHVDPGVARAAGFDQPILHGLASYGLVAKAIVDGLLGGDPDRLRGYGVRFAGALVPGQTLRTAVWREGERLVLAAACAERDGAPVLSHAWAELR
jgi:acyl dehydratase